FSKEFGFRVAGLDYSPAGCGLAREVLKSAGVEGDIICADLFTPPERLEGGFDAVVSFGVVEHFDDTAACVKAMAAFIKPGGVLVTSVPNLTGWIGVLQKLVNRPVYDIHRVILPEGLREAHEAAGLEVLECGYFVSTDFGVNNLTGIRTGTPSWLLKRILLSLLARVSRTVWLLEETIGELPAGRPFSPYIFCAARRRPG
ncbi:MAG: methyltransferase domain-containing protein, partial [Elusimicrobiales bacterium]|nr:methyltransferase domain-containing protein [Elusimicrobiales bacterium]